MTPPNYSSGTTAIYQNQIHKVVANYPDKKEAKLIVNGQTKNIPYEELFAVLTREEAERIAQELQAKETMKGAKELTAKTNV